MRLALLQQGSQCIVVQAMQFFQFALSGDPHSRCSRSPQKRSITADLSPPNFLAGINGSIFKAFSVAFSLAFSAGISPLQRHISSLNQYNQYTSCSKPHRPHAYDAMAKRRPYGPDGEGPRKRPRVVHEAPTSEDILSARQLMQLLAFDQDLHKARHGMSAA